MSDDLDNLKEQIDALKKQVRDLQSLVEGYVFVQKGIDSATQGFSGSQLTVQEIVIQGADGTGNTVGDIKGNQSLFGNSSFLQAPTGNPTYAEFSTMVAGSGNRALVAVLAAQDATPHFSGLNIFSPAALAGVPGNVSVTATSTVPGGAFTELDLLSAAFGISILATAGGDGVTQGRVQIGGSFSGQVAPSGTGIVQMFGDTTRIVNASRTPANSAAAGQDGEFCADSSFIYIHTGGSWRRVAVAAF